MLSGAAKSARNEADQLRKQGSDGAEAKASALEGKAAKYEKGAAALGGLGSYFQTNAAAGGVNQANGHTGGMLGPFGQAGEAGMNAVGSTLQGIAKALRQQGNADAAQALENMSTGDLTSFNGGDTGTIQGQAPSVGKSSGGTSQDGSALGTKPAGGNGTANQSISTDRATTSIKDK